MSRNKTIKITMWFAFRITAFLDTCRCMTDCRGDIVLMGFQQVVCELISFWFVQIFLSFMNKDGEWVEMHLFCHWRTFLYQHGDVQRIQKNTILMRVAQRQRKNLSKRKNINLHLYNKNIHLTKKCDRFLECFTQTCITREQNCYLQGVFANETYLKIYNQARGA